ncbi:MAG: hypothetical protein ABI939_08640 [Anaerolineaceae bacterium]
MTDSGFGLVLWATDVFALADFLETVAGAQVSGRHPGFAELNAGTVSIVIHADEAYRGHPWFNAVTREGVARGIGTEMRFSVSDVESAYREALKLGAQGIASPYGIDAGTECTVMGPDGYLFSLYQSG